MLQHKARQQLLDQGKGENEAKFEADMLASGRMVEQWREERQPSSAFVRMALALTDIGLEFIQGVTKPMIDALPESIADQMRYRDLVDALAGPCAEAAFALLAEATESFFGKDFADDKTLGVVTSALFEEIQRTTHDGSILDVFDEQGLIRMYRAGLRVAVERLALFPGDDPSAQTELFTKLLSGSAATLRGHPRLKGPVGTSLAAMVLEVVGENASVLFTHHWFDRQMIAN